MIASLQNIRNEEDKRKRNKGDYKFLSFFSPSLFFWLDAAFVLFINSRFELQPPFNPFT